MNHEEGSIISADGDLDRSWMVLAVTPRWESRRFQKTFYAKLKPRFVIGNVRMRSPNAGTPRSQFSSSEFCHNGHARDYALSFIRRRSAASGDVLDHHSFKPRLAPP